MSELEALREKVRELERRLADLETRGNSAGGGDQSAQILSILNHAPVVVWVLDLNGVCILSEGRGLEGIGFTPGQVVGRNVFEMYAAYPDIVRDTRRALNGEEFSTTAAVGGRFFETRFAPYFNTQGERIGAIGIAADVTELKSAQEQLETSERKYRHLVERSDDIIFSLTPEGRIISLSLAVRRHLGYAPEDLLDRPFTELIFEARGSARILDPRVLFMEKLAAVFARGRTFEFKMDFRTVSGDPFPLNVRLEKIQATGENQVFGKATRIVDDVLVRHCLSEKSVFRIGNNLNTADLLRQRLTANLSRYFAPEETNDVILGLQELLLNAIEHGNLNINFEEKSRALESARLQELVRTRQQDARYRDRSITVEYALGPQGVEYILEDEGEGFDHRHMLTRNIRDQEEAIQLHGRGLKLAQMAFDRIEYNEKGNRVSMIKVPRAASRGGG